MCGAGLRFLASGGDSAADARPPSLRGLLRFLDSQLESLLKIAMDAKAKSDEKWNARLIDAQANAATAAAAGRQLAPTSAAVDGSAAPSIAAASGLSAAAGATDAATTTTMAGSFVAPSSSAPPSASPAASPSGGEPIRAEWTDEEQSLLEKGMIEFPASLVPASLSVSERWQKIAGVVNTRTAKECIARFKFVRERLMHVQQEKQRKAADKRDAAEQKENAAATATEAVAAAASTVPPSRASEADEDALPPNFQFLDPDVQAMMRQRILDRKYEQQRSAAAAAAPAAPASESDSESESSGSDGEGAETGEESESAEDGKIDLNPGHRGTALQMSELQMEGIGVLKPHILRVEATCVRCAAPVEAELVPGAAPFRQQCGTCYLRSQLRLRASLVHESSSTLGYVDCTNLRVLDLLLIDVHAVCVGCFASLAFRAVQRGRPYEGACHSCHQRLRFAFANATVENITPPVVELDGAQGRGAAAKKRKQKKAAAAACGDGAVDLEPAARRALRRELRHREGIRVGQPLPNFGACSHYKNSYRWFRFNCCGRAFPCDLCHDAGADHPAVWASRQICGACSREQSSANHDCTCGNVFIAATTSYWQGGAGQRDRKKMSRNDRRKFKGLEKTTSRKAAAKAAGGKK
jgi:hypothetical protein